MITLIKINVNGVREEIILRKDNFTHNTSQAGRIETIHELYSFNNTSKEKVLKTYRDAGFMFPEEMKNVRTDQ